MFQLYLIHLHTRLHPHLQILKVHTGIHEMGTSACLFPNSLTMQYSLETRVFKAVPSRWHQLRESSETAFKCLLHNKSSIIINCFSYFLLNNQYLNLWLYFTYLITIPVVACSFVRSPGLTKL